MDNFYNKVQWGDDDARGQREAMGRLCRLGHGGPIDM